MLGLALPTGGNCGNGKWLHVLGDFFSATVLRHTTPDKQGHCHPAHVMNTCRSAFALTHNLMPARVPNRGTKATDSRGTDKYPIQSANRTRQADSLTPVPEEKLTPKRRQAVAGRNYLNPQSHRENTLSHAGPKKLSHS